AERAPAADPGARLSPVQPSGDHQVQHQEELALELEDDPLSHTAQTGHAAAFGLGDRRRDRPQQEGTPQPDLEHPTTFDSGRERRQVSEDVRKLGHGRRSLARYNATSMNPVSRYTRWLHTQWPAG